MIQAKTLAEAIVELQIQSLRSLDQSNGKSTLGIDGHHVCAQLSYFVYDHLPEGNCVQCARGLEHTPILWEIA